MLKSVMHFTLQATLKPGAADHFSRHRVTKADVGKRLLQIPDETENPQTSRARDDALSRLTGVLWVHCPFGQKSGPERVP